MEDLLTMSSDARERDLAKSTERSVDNDPTEIDPTIVRAILFPKSKSAVYTVQLEENRCVAHAVAEHRSPPPPSPPDDCACSSDPTKDNTCAALRRKDRGPPTIVLKRSQENERFTFGSSSSNDVVLKHPDNEYDNLDQKPCYIHLLHLQLYPDPDCNAFKLYNNSTSPFAVHTLPAARRFDDNLLPGENARLDCGRWRLRLGKGLDFEIRVLPNTHREAVHCSLISPITTVFPSKPKSKTESPKNPEKGIFERLAKSEIASVGKKVLKAERTGQGGRENQYLSHSKTPMLNETIGRTTRTQVFKATRNGMLVAIKMCRNLN